MTMNNPLHSVADNQPFPCVQIHLSALRHNVRRLQQLAPGSQLMAVVKANAYGHGMVAVAKALAAEAQGVQAFAVARLEEALTLRQAGICLPVLLLEGFFRSADLPLIARHRLQVVVHSHEQILALEQARLPQPISVWLKLDSGMHRLGFCQSQADHAWRRLTACASVAQPVHILSHFACADDAHCSLTLQQIALFNQFTADKPGERSLAASAGILQWVQAIAPLDLPLSAAQQSSLSALQPSPSPLLPSQPSLQHPSSQHSSSQQPYPRQPLPAQPVNWIRAGIILYGVSPLAEHSAAELGFQPVMSLTSRLIAVREHAANASVGYGASWRSSQRTRLGVIALGYGDGYPQYAPSGTPVLVNGREVATVGRISMDMICVDLGAHSQDRPGDPVLLWGCDRQNNGITTNALPVERIAKATNSSVYELITRLLPRLHYQYNE